MLADPSVPGHERSNVATRIFDAPLHLVWRAFIDPDHLKHWWGPNGFTNTIHAFDLKPGGAWRLTMHGPDGRTYENEFIFAEIEWLQRIILDHVSPPHFRLTLSFEADGAGTRLTFHQQFEAQDVYERVRPIAEPGLRENLDRLAAHLPQVDPLRRELTIVRSFAAPRDLVWRCWTEPRHLAKWWGPEGFTNPVCELDLRVGGRLRIVMRAPDGAEHQVLGVFQEIVAPERLVFTNAPVDDGGEPLIDGLTTVTFVERDGKTEMVLRTRAIGLAGRAALMIMGMGVGWNQSIDRLGRLLAEEAQKARS